MVRKTLALAAAMLLLPLAACGDTAGQSAAPTADVSPQATAPAPDATDDAAPDGGDEPGGPVLGGWGNIDDSSAPSLAFSPDGTFSGTDGCNGMAGSWREDGGRVILDPGPMTLKGCPDVDTWLRDAASVEPTGDLLAVYNTEGLRIGELSR